MLSSSLRFDVFVSPGVPAQPIRNDDHPFDWSPIASTLIRGKESAVLVDTAITIKQNTNLADWVESLLAPDQLTLTNIYITHGHADHFLGLEILQSRFPGVRTVATQGTVDHMKQQIDPAAFSAFWAKFFPGGQLPAIGDLRIAEALPMSNEFELEEHVLQAIEVGHTDTFDTTILWIPDLRLAVCGDVVYGDVHQYLAEADTREKRIEWIAALERVKSLAPKVVVAGHKRPGDADGVDQIDTSIAYLNDFQGLLDSGVRDARVLFDRMMEKYGGRINSHALSGGCAVAMRSNL